MASIERTAYPRFKSSLSLQELHNLYDPTIEELDFTLTHARGADQQLALLILLKSHQYLGYLPTFDEIPLQIRNYVGEQLSLPPETSFRETKNVRYRFRRLIRSHLNVKSYAAGGTRIAEQAAKQGAYTMSDPADLINLAVEHLIEQRFELPAFSTLDRLVTHIRHGVHQELYARITSSLGASDVQCLDGLLQVREGRTDFNRIKDTPGPATLKHLRQWTKRLEWLESILPTQPFLTGIANTKIQQFAAEAAALDVGDMRDIQNQSRCHSLLIYFLYQAQVEARDALAQMLLKRMRRTTTAARKAAQRTTRSTS